MEVSEYTIDDFLREMGLLQFKDPGNTNHMWVFWSKEEGQGQGGDLNNNRTNVQEYLKSLLCNVDNDGNILLIQFWAPTTITSSTIGEGYVFKTLNQPFALNKIESGICEYRKHCTSLEFNIFPYEEKYGFDFGSTIGRVFRDKEAASFIDDRLPDFVPQKLLHPKILLLPLFKPSSRCCSGVLEVVGSYTVFWPSQIPNEAKVIFKEANFMNPPSLELQESTEMKEINKALQGVCTTLELPLAQIWVPCCTSTAMAYVDSPGKSCHFPSLSCSNKFSSAISQNGDAYIHYKEIEEFNLSCHSLKKGESIVGKSLLYHKPCFCRDVTQLPWAEYPNFRSSRMFKFTGCYAIWLHSTCIDYVLEFYVPHWNTIFGDPLTFLGLLLATVKKQLPGFKISSVGKESCVEVYEISVNDDEPDSVRISQTLIVKLVPESFGIEKEMVQNKVVGETVIDSLEENGMVVCHSEKTAGEKLFGEAAMDDEITRRLLPMPESLRNENEVVPQLSDDERAVRKKELNGGIVKQTNAAVTSSERIFISAEASEREYRTTDITLSREDLTKHFGKKLDDAAKIFNVSRSTMKRALRHHKIDKWPLPKRKKVVHSDNEGTYKGDPSCSDSAPTPATAGISHKTSNSRQEHDVGNVTIKATLGNDTFRFKLPFSSRKADLVEKVKTRVSLNEGSFNIKYQDEENEWISIACDDDLGECIDIWQGKSKIIKMLVVPITNQAP